MGINADRCGIYLKLDEFRELSDRLNILEGLHSGDVIVKETDYEKHIKKHRE